MSSNNVISGSVVLTPIAAVDTSTASSGVTMYSLVFESSMLANANIIQFEYWVASSATPLTSVSHGFLPLENAVTTTGISNQITLAIPSLNNEFNPSSLLEAKVRVYFGQTTVPSGQIVVSNWSNTCPVHNAPPQPTEVRAFIVAGEVGPSYSIGDQLYVQLYDNPAYTSDISFIVSYNYKDQNGENKWNVTAPLDNWTEHTFVDPSFNSIVLPAIPMPTDVAFMSNISVTVNAVYSYVFNSNTYFSVSEISDPPAIAEAPTITSPVLNPIYKSDYSVYDNGSQTIAISWEPPVTSLLPNFEVASYSIYVNNAFVVNVLDTVTNYTYTVDSSYLPNSTQSTTALSFKVVAIGTTGAQFESNVETINTFLYATAPQFLAVAWANSGSTTPGSGVDIALSFRNPSSVGFGSPIDFTVNVFDVSGNIAESHTVSYDSSQTVYAVFLNNVMTTSSGEVAVFLNTRDTNSEDIEEGATAGPVGYTVSDAPFITEVVYTGTTASFAVISNTLLVETNKFTYQESDVTSPVFLNFSSVPGNYGNYVVSRTELSTGDFRYTFVFNTGYYPGNPLVAIASVSNAVAISSVDLKFYTTP